MATIEEDAGDTPATEEAEPARPANSRESLRAAGWSCEVGRHRGFVPDRRPLSWLRPGTLWVSRNDTVASLIGDPVNDLRRAWMRISGAPPVLDHTGRPEVAFMVVGDPGEGDASQWATIPALEATWGGSEFMVIMSDVIYPAGSVNEYEEKFYRPYRDFPGPIYAVPGNHDWYDDLQGFMYHLCRQEEVPGPPRGFADSLPAWRRGLHRLLWRRPEQRRPKAAAVRAVWRSRPEQRSAQRAPYWTIETDAVRIVGIDTGIAGALDRDQGAWLAEVSRDRDRPKILITGKPIYVDGEYHPCPIEGGGTVDEIVRDPEHNYLAVIGGDVHNYQRYPVRVDDDGRVILYLVAGGGGAFMHPTHDIPRVRLAGVDEDGFRCYPRRGDSLALFSRLYDRLLARGRGHWEISPDEAAAYLGERMDINPNRLEAREVVLGERARRAAQRILPLPGRARGPLHSLFALLFDRNDPPMFKSFLRIEASERRVRIRCLAATGCAEHENDPPPEDDLAAEPGADGAWRWYSATPGEDFYRSS